uniref:DUF6913 domain-containing protein n=1 Tax=Flavobacterium sp. TaxID=239 RepID=UPI004049FCC2
MFSNIIKNFFIKRIAFKKLSDYSLEVSSDKVNTIAVIFNDTNFKEKKALISEIERFGIDRNNIKILVYKTKINKKEVNEDPFVTLKDISFLGDFNKKEVQDFISTPFDLLINYYEINDPALILISTASKAKFKVGFTSADSRINSFMINLHLYQYKEFVAELFKYIKILNKL